MKKIFYILCTGLFLIVFSSCSLEDTFLEKPDTSGLVDTDQIYSSTKNAEGALFRCYSDVLRHGWPGSLGFSHGLLGSLSGELTKGDSWFSVWSFNNAGLMPTQVTNQVSGCAGTDNYNQNWQVIRACFLVKENIERVPDMSDLRKKYIKAEATALIAYRYMGMFYRYGGVPIVRKAFLPDDDVALPRASLQEVLDYTLELLNEAIPSLPDSWANFEGSNFTGRLTKGAALAIKARVLTFAARPLFNSATPYLPFGENSNMICFGNVDPQRWLDAIAANEAVLAWAAPNGYRLIYQAGPGNRNTFEQAAHDYGTATSTPSNPEVILAYKTNAPSVIAAWYNQSGAIPVDYGTTPGNAPTSHDKSRLGVLSNFLENYRNRDGQEIDWPNGLKPEPTYRPFSNYLQNIDQIEARYRMDIYSYTRGALNNPGISGWNEGWRTFGVRSETKADGYSEYFPSFAPTLGSVGCAPSTKFYYRAGTRGWFEPPLFRLAETYLNLAEAYNEAGNSAKALENLNMVNHRAGLPTITETDQQALRRLIWREKAVEYFNENHRYFDVKHWKHPEIATNICGGPKREFSYIRKSATMHLASEMWGYWDAVTYTSFWHDKMFLEPFPQAEVNKGKIVQNPGY